MKGQIRRLHGEISTKNHLSYMHLTSEGLWSRIQEFANFKYQVNQSLVISVHKKKLRNLIVLTWFLFKFELPDAARTRVKTLAVIRNLCQKVVLYIYISPIIRSSLSKFFSSKTIFILCCLIQNYETGTSL